MEWPERLGDGAAAGAARRPDRRDRRRAPLDPARGRFGRVPALPGRGGMTHDGRRRAILAIDTATTRVVIATGQPAGVADGVSTWTAGYRHGETCCRRSGGSSASRTSGSRGSWASSWGRGRARSPGCGSGSRRPRGWPTAWGSRWSGSSTAESLIEAFEAAEGTGGPTVLLLPAGPSDRIVVRAGSRPVPLPAGEEPDLAPGERLVAVDLEGRAPDDALARGEIGTERASARRCFGPARRSWPPRARGRDGRGPPRSSKPSSLTTSPSRAASAPTTGTVEWSRDPR